MTLFILFALLLGCITASRICPVCYDVPCPGTDKSRLFCQINTDGLCGQCNTSCIQCNSTSSPYVCVCPAPYPTNSPTPPTRSPTPFPTMAPTEEPTAAPTNAPTYAPTQPLPPLEILFAPTPAPTSPTEAPTRRPTKAPTRAPTVSPTRAPTIAPPPFNECRFCNSTTPPPSIPCNDTQHKLLMLCKAYDNVTCIPCPPYCSFCYPVLAPSPVYVCTCPITKAPTPAPTKAPTQSPTTAPTGAPTKNLPDLVSKKTLDDAAYVSLNLLLIVFGCLLAVICVVVCCIMQENLCGIKRREEIEHEL